MPGTDPETKDKHMKIRQTFKKVGNTIRESFKSQPTIKEMNIVKANARISELENKLNDTKSEPMFETDTDFMKTANAINKDLESRIAAGKVEIERLKQQSANRPTPFDLTKYVSKEEARNAFKTQSKYSNNLTTKEYTDIMQTIYYSDLPEKVSANKMPVRSRFNIQDTTTQLPTESETVATMAALGVEYVIESTSKSISNVAPHYFAKWDYYLMNDNGKVYFQQGNMSLPTILIKKSSKADTSAQSASNQNTVINNLVGEKETHLTTAEYNELVKANVSQQNLFKVYRQLANKEKVKMNVNIATPVWS